MMQLQISPQRVAVGPIVHDNNWPVPSHGAGESFAKQQPPQEKEPGLVSDIAHTVLDVAGLIPVIGEVADGANALFYLAEGNKTDAALSAAAMVPVAGWAATGGKLVRKVVKTVRRSQKIKKLKGAKQLQKLRPGKKVAKAAASMLNGELATGTYRDLVKLGKRGDNLTPHHIPSDAYMKLKGGKKYSRDNGVSVMVEQPSPGVGGRHRKTKTYGGNMTDAQRQAYYDLSPKEALEHDINDLRKIYKDQNLYDQKVEDALQEIIQKNKQIYPDIFD